MLHNKISLRSTNFVWNSFQYSPLTILSQLHPPLTLQLIFLMHVNGVPSSPSQYSKWKFSKRHLHQNSVFIPCLSHSSLTSNQSQPPEFQYPNKPKGPAQTIKFLVTQYPALPVSFTLLRSKAFTEQSVLNHLWFMYFLCRKRHVSHA
jgi:hypothetical protein